MPPRPPKRLISHGIDLLNLPLDAISTFGEDGNSPPNKATHKIDDFKANLKNSIEQPSFFISTESWKKLINGENESGRWLKDNEEVHGFIFCIAFPEQHDLQKYAYFRIRTIVKSNNKIIKVHGIDSDTLHIPEMEIPNIFPIQIEQNNIAFVDIKSALEGEWNDSLKFADYFSGSVINHDVTIFKRNENHYFLDTPIANFDKIKGLPQTEKMQKQKIQQGTIFSSKCVFFDNLNNKEVKGMRISFGWDKENHSFTYIIQINPTGEIDGIKCPVPETGCNYA